MFLMDNFHDAYCLGILRFLKFIVDRVSKMSYFKHCQM